MGRLTAYLWRMIRSWERPTQIAFAVGLALFGLAFVVLQFGPVELRQPSLIGVIGLLFVCQIIFMWGNRHMVTPYTQAQRKYLAEDFAGACAIMEQVEAQGKADVNTLTLLANSYRQLGDLDKSEEIVKKALALRPNHHFPLYAFGRTLLIKGQFKEAAAIFQQALEAGAPEIVRIDLGEALYRAGDGAARETLEQALALEQEPFRRLMMGYLLYRMGAAVPPSPEQINAGLLYWQETARRFKDTPYAQSLADDVLQMQSLLEDL